MEAKAFLEIVILFIAVAASVVIPVRTFEVRLATSPAEDVLFVKAGEPFSVACKGVGDDGEKFAFMKWLNKDENIIPEGDPGVQKDGQNSIRLRFTFPKISQSGVYKCSAVYDDEHILEKSIKIIFYGPKPTFESYFENITAEEGSKLEINCSAVGEAPIDYEWYQDEDKVSDDPNSPIFATSTGNHSTLVIKKVTRSHEAMYTCMAKNEYGLSSKVYQLTVVPSSGDETDNNGTSSILKVEARNITSTSVRFFIVVSGNVKSIEVKYIESRNGTEYRKEWNYGDNYEVKDLLPSGLYTFQFRTVPSGSKGWSQSYNVTLLPDKPELIIQNVHDGSVRLTWFVKLDDVMRGTIDSYEVKYFLVQMQSGNYWIPDTSCAVTVQIPTCKGSVHIISGLSRRVYYEIQLRAHTASGYGEAYKQKVYLSS